MDVRKQLRDLGVKPVKGQNFLTDELIVQALVEAGEIDEQNVLEIGGGTGVITEKIVEKAREVTVVEADAVLAEHLRQGLDVEVVEKDFLEYKLEEGDFDRCVSNLPFQITSEAIEKLGKAQLQSVLILQKELAEKMVAEPGNSNYGSFTILANYYFIPVKLREVSSKSYYPSPEVDTAIVKLYPNKERHGVEDEKHFFKISRALFTHKRKKVRNAFVDARHILDYEKENAKKIRDELPHSEERVVNLDIRQMAEIAEYLAE